MKVFLSSTYLDLIEHRKAAHKKTKTIHEYGHECTNTRLHSFIRESFVDGMPENLRTGIQP